MSHDFTLCGWRVHSALAMPELLAWQGDDRPLDIDIALGKIPERLETPAFTLPFYRLWANGDFLLDMANVGRFWVQGGRKVVIEPCSGISESELRVFILGTVFGILCHQRGLLPIHASAVRIDGRAAVFAGNSGMGKSTLAAALGTRGHALMADDVVAIDPDSLMARPAFPQRKLGLDVMETLAIEQKGLVAIRPNRPKFCVPAPDGFDSSPLPPAAVYILKYTDPKQTSGFEQLNRVKAMAQIHLAIYRRAAGLRIQPHDRQFNTIRGLVQSVPVYMLSLEKGAPLNHVYDLAEQIESHVRNIPTRA